MDGAAYGGLRIDIDKYYQEESNKKKLEEINNSAFGEMFDEKGNKKTGVERIFLYYLKCNVIFRFLSNTNIGWIRIRKVLLYYSFQSD